MPDIGVVRNDRKHRYEAVRNGAVVGVAHFTTRQKVVIFTHTEVQPEYEGRGVGTTLARRALDDVRARGQRIIPQCPFIGEYVARHPAYADLVDAPAPSA